ncbi:MAG: ABC transporter ATP-binding protein [Steroidobacteraceae bacterium]|nr:ABC transporter ATP-binding protein [Nevskiaceae bacterium]MCP5360256.1 ABC transporter ATP-binding protein [Nevskiaceae bacterium]MCP5466607.1 ABC transporter ATP-binding protein [Nevskiaceae bacterium]
MFGIDRRLIVGSTSRWLRVGIAVGVLGLVASLLLYWFLGQAIDAMVRGEDLLQRWAPWIAVLLLAKLVLGWSYRAAQYRASSLTKLTLRDKMYEHALKLGPAVLDRKRTGELVNIAVDGMDWVEMFYGIYFVQFVIGMATPLLLCVFVGSIDWVTGLVLLVSVPLTPAFLGMMARNFRRASRRYAEVNNEQSVRFLDSIQGMATLKMFNLGRVRGQEMHAAGEAQRAETMRLLLVNQVMILFVDFGFALGTTLVLTVVGLLRMQAGALTPGEVVALVLASAEFSKPLTLIGQFFFAGAVGREFARKIVAFLGEAPSVAEPPAPPAGTPAAAPLLSKPALVLRDLVYRYAGAEQAAVDGVTLDLRPGETVALVGPSGSGKTTLTSLILRTLAAESGGIRLDEVPVESRSADWVRAHIALVPQDPYLFHGTIAENLRVARADASDAELIEACRAANLLQAIEKMPAGLDTVVGERGAALSGGQVQRLAIARAILKDAPIVVLDEPTSQIDTETEAVIQEAIAHLARDRAVLLIAHRLSTIEQADRIVVMNHGRVVEAGSHAELLARGGLYARMRGVGAPPSRTAAAVAAGVPT